MTDQADTAERLRRAERQEAYLNNVCDDAALRLNAALGKPPYRWQFGEGADSLPDLITEACRRLAEKTP